MKRSPLFFIIICALIPTFIILMMKNSFNYRAPKDLQDLIDNAEKSDSIHEKRIVILDFPSGYFMSFDNNRVDSANVEKLYLTLTGHFRLTIIAKYDTMENRLTLLSSTYH